MRRFGGAARGAAGLALTLLAGLAAATVGGCGQGGIPFYDPVPAATRVAMDKEQAVRIEHRRQLLDWIAAHPDDHPAVQRLAESEWSIGRQTEAVEVLDYLLHQLNPDHPDAAATPQARAVLLEKLRYLSEMAYDAARFAEADRILAGFAPAERSAAYWYQAAQLHDRVAEAPPVGAEVPTAVARAAARKQTIADLDATLAQAPNHSAALQLRARLAFEDGDWPRVIELCERWSRVLPKDGQPWYTRGVALQRLKKNDAALPMFQQAARLEPNQPDPWYGLAVANLAAGTREAAQQALIHVLLLQPNNAQAYFKLYELYSEQPLTAARFEYLVRAATLARDNPWIQQTLVDVTRDGRMKRPDLLLFGLENLMHIEMAKDDPVSAAPLLAYVAEAQAQGHDEEAFEALAHPILHAREFKHRHPEMGLMLLRLAARWIDPETGRWSPPQVELLDPVHPLSAENIGRPVRYKDIMDYALNIGYFEFLARDWSQFLTLDQPTPGGDAALGGPDSLAAQLSPADRAELALLLAQLNAARAEHLARVQRWQQVLAPMVPFSVLPSQVRLDHPVSGTPEWWLAGGWDAFRHTRASDLLDLDFDAAQKGLVNVENVAAGMREQLQTGLSRDNFSATEELFDALGGVTMAVDRLSKLPDPLAGGDTPENRQRERAWIYALVELAPGFQAEYAQKGAPSDPRMQRLEHRLDAAMQALPAALAHDPSQARREVLLRDYWFWQLSNDDRPDLQTELAHPKPGSFEARDAYACAIRLWLRLQVRQRSAAGKDDTGLSGGAGGAGGATAAPDGGAARFGTTMREDLEGMLDGLVAGDTVPGRRLRMQLAMVIGMALGDQPLAASAGENLVQIAGSLENGGEIYVLKLLAAIYERQHRWYPAIYCLRRAVTAEDASRQDLETKGDSTYQVPEDLRGLRWRLVTLYRRVGDEALAEIQLQQIAGVDAELKPLQAGGTQGSSPARAAALYDLAVRHMAHAPMKDGFGLCRSAWLAVLTPDDSIQEYRLIYGLIALATDAGGDASAIRRNLRIDERSTSSVVADDARVWEAFDAALAGKSDLLLTTPQLADGYALPAHDALRLALAIAAARRGDIAAAAENLRQAKASHCLGVAAMVHGIDTLVQGLLAKQRGDAQALAHWRKAWAEQGGLAQALD
ncbi:MAG: tetratricopeptide repeat protein [Planctomycetota bacterium]